MSRAVYSEQGKMARGTRLGRFLDALAPVLRRYGIDYRPDEFEQGIMRTASPGQDVMWVLGDPAGAHLTYRWGYDPGCGYDTPGEFIWLDGENLIDAVSGTRLEARIGLTDFLYPPCYLSLRFEGAEEEIAVIRRALEPVLEACDYRRS